MIKNSVYPSKYVCLHKIFHKEKYLQLEKAVPMAKSVNQYMIVLYKKQANRVVVLLVALTYLKYTCQYKNVTSMNGIVNQHENMFQRNSPKSWLFYWLLSPLLGNHEYTYTCVLLSFV